MSSPFEMMNITVSVEVLEGLTMNCKLNPNQQLGIETGITSVESMENFKKASQPVPVTAIVSYFKNVSSNQRIATHIPSIPLGTPSISKGNKKHLYLIRWPTDFDPMGDALSTFRFSRLMRKRESNYDNMLGHIGIDNNSKGFIAEEIKLQIGLMRGKEILTLGVANLVITGDEEDEVIMDIPIIATKDPVKEDPLRSPSPLRRTGSKLFGNSQKTVKKQSFPSDSKRKYKLDENALIRLHVKVVPDSTVNSSSSSIDEVESEVNENYYLGPASAYADTRPPKASNHNHNKFHSRKKTSNIMIQKSPSRIKNTLRSSENLIKMSPSHDVGRAPFPQDRKIERRNSFVKSKGHSKQIINNGSSSKVGRSQSTMRGEMKLSRSKSKDYSSVGSKGSKSTKSKSQKRSSSEKKPRKYEEEQEPAPPTQNAAAWLIESLNNITSFAPTPSGEVSASASDETDDYYEKQRAYRDRRYQRRSKSYSSRSTSDSDDNGEDYRVHKDRNNRGNTYKHQTRYL